VAEKMDHNYRSRRDGSDREQCQKVHKPSPVKNKPSPVKRMFVRRPVRVDEKAAAAIS
jgi:hypothetical protein